MKFFSILFSAAIITMISSIEAEPFDSPMDCPRYCPSFYSPVCAVDGDTFSSPPRSFENECRMRAEGCLRKINYIEIDLEKCEQPGNPESGSTEKLIKNTNE